MYIHITLFYTGVGRCGDCCPGQQIYFNLFFPSGNVSIFLFCFVTKGFKVWSNRSYWGYSKCNAFWPFGRHPTCVKDLPPPLTMFSMFWHEMRKNTDVNSLKSLKLQNGNYVLQGTQHVSRDTSSKAIVKSNRGPTETNDINVGRGFDKNEVMELIKVIFL